jgi:hypothetical protein
MSEQERLELGLNLDNALKEAYVSMLRKKAQLDETIIITDAAGNPIEVSAKERLAKYLAENK